MPDTPFFLQFTSNLREIDGKICYKTPLLSARRGQFLATFRHYSRRFRFKQAKAPFYQQLARNEPAISDQITCYRPC